MDLGRGCRKDGGCSHARCLVDSRRDPFGSVPAGWLPRGPSWQVGRLAGVMGGSGHACYILNYVEGGICHGCGSARGIRLEEEREKVVGCRSRWLVLVLVVSVSSHFRIRSRFCISLQNIYTPPSLLTAFHRCASRPIVSGSTRDQPQSTNY